MPYNPHFSLILPIEYEKTLKQTLIAMGAMGAVGFAIKLAFIPGMFLRSIQLSHNCPYHLNCSIISPPKHLHN